MGSRNSKSNSGDKKTTTVVTHQVNNDSNANNLDISMQTLDNSLDNTSNYKGITYRKQNNVDNQLQKSDNYNSDQLTQEKSYSDSNQSLFFNIIWNEGGNDVYIIGKFSNWKNKIKMNKTNSGKNNNFEKEVPIPNIQKEKFVFKFIVDNEWKYSKNYPKTTDHQGNINNYIDYAFVNSHLNQLKKKENETVASNNENNLKNSLNKSKENSKDNSTKSIYGNIYPSNELLNQEPPKMPDVLNIVTNLSEKSHQTYLGNKKYLKYTKINFSDSYKNIFVPGHSYFNHLLINKKNIKANQCSEKQDFIDGGYFQINCNVKIKAKCLSILYFSPIND